MPDSQSPFAYSDAEVEALKILLSAERLTAYAQKTLQETVKLYEKNTLLSEALYGLLQGAEIATRNSIHNAMSAGIDNPSWYDHIAWQSPEADALDKAKNKLLDQKQAPSAGRIVSELTFGFWVQMTATKYEKALWVPYVHKAFPFIKTDRKGLHSRLQRIRSLRNRVAHHERIFHLNLQLDYAQINEVIRWICPVTANWIDRTNRLKGCLAPPSAPLVK